MKRFIFKNKTAIVTGGTSGIGEATAYELAARGCNVIITGRNEQALQTITDELKALYPDQKFDAYKLDFDDLSGVSGVVKKIISKYEHVDLLINNAGVAMAGTFEQLSAEDFEKVMTVNFRSQVAMVRELLPFVRHNGHIANTSSIFGIITPASQSAYSSSKFAVRGFSEVLRQELASRHIGVSTIFPGGVKTNIAKNALIGKYMDKKKASRGVKKFEANLTLTPEFAAKVIVSGIQKRKARIIIGGLAKFMDVMTRILPARYVFLLKSIK